MELPLLPKPKAIVSEDASLSIGRSAHIVLESPDIADIAQTLASDLAKCSIDTQLTDSKNSGSEIHLCLDKAPPHIPNEVADQGYSLQVSSSGVRLVGWGRPGLYFGTRTLLQLLNDDHFPVCRITDWPDLKYRMVLYDLAREQTCNMSYLKAVLDRLSNYKINMLNLYLENRFQFTRHPLISPPGVMTAEQAKELDEYARSRFVELVPQVNCLSHLEQALAVDEYRRLAEDPERPEMVCPLNPETPGFIEDLIGEVMACFSTKFFHMGGDEAWQMGSCPACRTWVSEHDDISALFALHYNRVHDFITKHGRQAMMWGDMILDHRRLADLLPNDLIIFDWHYAGGSTETLQFFRDKGFDVFACPAMSGFGRTAAPFKHAQGNIWTLIGEGMEHNAIGECTCAWELRLGHFFDNDCFGIILSADRSWNTDACELDDFNRRFCKVFYGMDDLRPVRYFEAVSDGFADIHTKHLPDFPARSSWQAFSADLWPNTVRKDMYEELTAYQKDCLELLNSIRQDAKRNRETLDFADIPAHTSMLLAKRGYLFRLAARLGSEGKKAEALAALEEIEDELDYFESRFNTAVERFGGSTTDLERINSMRQVVDKLRVYIGS